MLLHPGRSLKKQFLNRFVGLQNGSILHCFFAVRQQGLVAEYRARFEHLLASLGKLEEETMATVFCEWVKQETLGEIDGDESHRLERDDGYGWKD